MSHETLYRSLFVQARGVLKKGADSASSVEAIHPSPVHARATGNSQGQIVDAISIRRETPRRCPKTAPSPVTGRGICSQASGSSHIATLVERHSRFVILGRNAEQRHGNRRRCAEPLRRVRKLPASLRRSLTWDRRIRG